MARLSLSLLGPFQATLDGEPIARFESDKVRALLAYLAVEADCPHRREALVGLLWPDWPEAAARRNLSHALANLRRAIDDNAAAPPFLLITPQTIQFNRAADYYLDVEAFSYQPSAVSGRPSANAPFPISNLQPPTSDLQSLTSNLQSPISALQSAVELYRGSFLEGFSLKDCPAFDDWVLLTRERLQRQALAALQQVATYCEQRGEVDLAVGYARREVELEPWREEAQRRLMRLLALSGQRSAALVQYAACRRILKEEMGVEPESETTALYERLQSEQDLHAHPLATAHNLPASLIPLVGREAELAEIKDCLQDPACRLLSLVGPGGSGKTRLVLEVAARHLDQFAHGVFFVSLASLQSADAVAPTVAEALGLTLYSSAGSDPEQQLLDYLRRKNLLLILDNFEHLLAGSDPGRRDGVDLVAHILRSAPQVKIMTTSRVRLNARDEQLLFVGGIDFPPANTRTDPPADLLSEGGREEPKDVAQDVAKYSAVKLFVLSARRVHPGFAPTAGDLAHIARICCLVEGMPLAILLAASWMMMLTPAEIAAQMTAQSLDFLETGWRDVPVRQRSMRAVFDYSWSLLTGREREVFAALSVFRGGFFSQAAQPVAGASLRELLALVDRSLLQRTSAGRYEMHELLRQYAAEKLAEAPDEDCAARDRHSVAYTAALQGWAADLRGFRQQAALEEMEAEIENARAAWDWAVKRGQVERLEQALDGLCRFYKRRGRYREGEGACQAAAARLQAEPSTRAGGKGIRIWAKALAWQSNFSRILGRAEFACQLLQEALALLDNPALSGQNVWPEQAFILQQMGRLAFASDRQAARQLWEKSLALYRALGDQWGEANVLRRLGRAAESLGDCSEAKQLHEEGLAIRRSLGDRIGIVDSLIGLSIVAGKQGQFEEADRLAREGIELCREIGDRAESAYGLETLAALLVYQGKFAEAHPLLEESAAINDDLGRRTSLAWVNEHLIWAKINLGLYESARALGQEMQALFHEIGAQGAGICFLALGEIALARQAYIEAQQWLQECVALLGEVGQREEEGVALAELGHAALGMGQRLQAQQHLCSALRVASETGAMAPSIFSIAKVALLLADQGEVERAVELYALASRYPYIGNSRYWEDIAGKPIAAVAATLPPEAVTAARERGRARDMAATLAELLVELETEFDSR
jgi:predicted ATPase/DNA-binding SARP family transcriptional activator